MVFLSILFCSHVKTSQDKALVPTEFVHVNTSLFVRHFGIVTIVAALVRPHMEDFLRSVLLPLKGEQCWIITGSVNNSAVNHEVTFDCKIWVRVLKEINIDKLMRSNVRIEEYRATLDKSIPVASLVFKVLNLNFFGRGFRIPNHSIAKTHNVTGSVRQGDSLARILI